MITIKRFTTGLLFITATAAAGGCNFERSPVFALTEGELGSVEFSYSGWDCLLGCPIEKPLLVGTSRTIGVSDAGHGADITARSSDPGVATFERQRQCDDQTGECVNAFATRALAVGDVKLELVDAGGEVVDRVKIEVREAAAASLTTLVDDEALEPVDGRYFDVKVGDSIQIDAEFRDPDGRTLLDPESGVQWQTSDPSIASLEDAWYYGSSGRSIVVEGKAPGEVTLTVAAPGVSEMVTIRVN
jgi:hypothetical protein